MAMLMTGYGVLRMRSNKSMRYIYVDYDFYREEKGLIRDNMQEKEKWELKKKVLEMKKEIENIRLNLPEGVSAEFRLVPNGSAKEFVGSMELMVHEQGFEEWEKFVKKEGGAEQFIKKIMEERRDKLIEKIKEIKKEVERKIDVRVLGRTGMHRVYSEGGKLKCDCKLFERIGECHHVELVKNLEREGVIKEGNQVVEPPVILWRRGEGETKYDKERYIISIPEEDRKPTLTVRMLHSYGYGLGAMREMGIVPKQFKLEQLEEVVHGASYEEVLERMNKEERIEGVNMVEEMEMGA